MILPSSAEDDRLLGYDPLRTFLALWHGCESRSQKKQTVDSFVQDMQKNDQAVVAAKTWICYATRTNAKADELELLDGGDKLYRAFFEFYCLKNMSGKAVENLTRIEKQGLEALQIRHRHAVAYHPASRNTGNTRGRRGRARPAHSSRNGMEHADVQIRCTENEHIVLTTGIRGSTNSPSMTSTNGNVKKRGNIHQKSLIVSPSAASEKEIPPSNLVRPQAGVPVPVAEICKYSVPAPREAGEMLTPAAHEKERCADDVTFNAGGECLHDGINPESSQFDALKSKSHSGASVSSQSIGIEVARKNYQQLAKGHLTHSSADSGTPVNPRTAKRSRRSSATCHQDGVFIPDSGMAPRIGPAGGVVNSTEASLTDQQRDGRESSIDDPVISTRPQYFAPSLVLPVSRESKQPTSRRRALLDLETSVGVPESNLTPPQVSVSYPITAKDVQPVPRKLAMSYTSTGSVNHAKCGIESFESAAQSPIKNALEALFAGCYDDPSEWVEDMDLDSEDEEVVAEDDTSPDKMDVQNVPVHADTASKPRLPSKPCIWAKSRQEICETLDHFRSYHSGVYSRKDIVKGYLLGAFSASRDIFCHGGKLIISHGGGKAESLLDSTTGRRLQSAQDQTASDKSVRALLKTYKEKRPLVLLADDKYALFPYDLSASGYTYVVLGVYWISHAWAEYQPAGESSRIVRWKFAFQWCEGQGIPWWMDPQELEKTPQPSRCPSEGVASLDCSTKAKESDFECKQCLQRSPFVYKQNRMCLNPTCTEFWVSDGKEPQELAYREEFLKLLPQAFENLPRVKPTIARQPAGQLAAPNRCRGWHCARCGRLSSRYKWECWECVSCQDRHVINARIRMANEFWNQRLPSEFLHSRINRNSGIFTHRPQPIDLGKGRGFTNRLTFVLPNYWGKIHLILGTPLSNGEANMIFEDYQRQAFSGELKLRRYPLKTHRVRGTLLTNYFSQNSGEPYQYVGGTDNTVPFTEAPACVRKALDLIKERAYLGLQLDEPFNFNEVLSAAYLERQKMSFHSDSEKGLGPIVASLSLGSAALMHFRSHISPEFPKQKQLVMSLILRHGDVLIMEGHDVQIHYEHTVIPFNFRIAATARYIDSTLI